VAHTVASDHTVRRKGKRWGLRREQVCVGLGALVPRSNVGSTARTGCASAVVTDLARNRPSFIFYTILPYSILPSWPTLRKIKKSF
jgi:hypothetical protein